jgi:hypothetical protein
LAALYAKRVDSGHPSAVYVEPRRGALYFDEEEALRWARCRRREIRGRARCWANYSGNADDLVTIGEAARILGYHGPATIRSYLSRFPGYFPSPAHTQLLPNGRAKKLWRRAQIWDFSERRGSGLR